MPGEAPGDIVAAVERGLQCWNRNQLEQMLDAYAPDAELDLSASIVDETVRRGHEQIREWMQHVHDFWSPWRLDSEQFVELPDDRYMVMVRMGGADLPTKLDGNQPFAFVYTFRDGKVSRLAIYRDAQSALQALGLVAT